MLPLHTTRLTVRMLRAADLPAFVGYRNDTEVAHYQDWPLPYTEGHGDALAASQEALNGPSPGVWVQLAVDHAGQMVGDVAVGLSVDGRTATVGYTIARAHQGHAFAGEAVAAVVDALCAHGVHRFEASLDPRNVASMRVVESVGFQFESLVHDAFISGGDWVDDLRYSLLAPQRAAWRERTLSPASGVRLVALDGDNIDAYLALATHHSQQRFVRPVEASLAQAAVPLQVRGLPFVSQSLGIEADGEPVGFVQLADRNDLTDEPYLWRLLIDRRHQRRGIGTQVLQLVAERTQAAGARSLTVSYREHVGSPRPLYLRFGFVPTGDVVEGEALARLSW
ncbi:MAG: GNAT family N-acetyltransferase [Actinomycetota bacterium]|nr:GNAT family N-acetyltransferase [Actinomycetota bacterium]